MEATQVKSRQNLGGLLSSIAVITAVLVLFFVLPVLALLHFQEQIKQAEAYGYLGVLLVGLLCGITVIPAPTQALVFTFGGMLNPWLVGVVAGTGSAIGGMTVYLTGAGAASIWARLHNREVALEHRLGVDKMEEKVPLKKSRLWGAFEAVYNKMSRWINGRQGGWALFITSALVFSPFYPAGIAAGSMKMGLRKFFLISWAGRIVGYSYVAYAGYLGLVNILHLIK